MFSASFKIRLATPSLAKIFANLSRQSFSRGAVISAQSLRSVSLKATTENDNRGIKVWNLSGKLTIVTVAHRLSTVTGCDKVVDLCNKAAVVAETVT
jgi:hypothetical protein